MTTNLQIAGLHCQSCKLLIESVCRDLPGVQNCDVSVEQGAAVIEHDPELDLSRLIQEITQLGEYKVSVG